MTFDACSICCTVDIDVIWYKLCTEVCRCFSFRFVVLYSCLILFVFFFFYHLWWNKVAQSINSRNVEGIYNTKAVDVTSTNYTHIPYRFFSAPQKAGQRSRHSGNLAPAEPSLLDPLCRFGTFRSRIKQNSKVFFQTFFGLRCGLKVNAFFVFPHNSTIPTKRY